MIAPATIATLWRTNFRQISVHGPATAIFGPAAGPPDRSDGGTGLRRAIELVEMHRGVN